VKYERIRGEGKRKIVNTKKFLAHRKKEKEKSLRDIKKVFCTLKIHFQTKLKN
jgi:hypothetical protein